jgi:16S rRNA (guanine966-N2)-methyltransferase
LLLNSYTENAFIYVEADRELSQLKLPSSWQKIKETKAGIVRAGLYQKKS